ncbi:hypothetical protein AN958_12179 [Leucoagaricus sp. SymC.cos]|nr:hypothetical protein AN958_12179 [Leucoagaricus sp. SymC.cos]
MLSEPIDQPRPRGCEDLPQDEDSLFGSPPPSPSAARGRSPSSALALSSASSSGPQCLSSSSTTQNVGTIALPGSHTHSEPQINPIASLSLPGGLCTPFLPQPLPSSYPQSRQAQLIPPPPPPLQQQPARRPPAQTRKQAPKRKAKSTTPRPPPPAIPLPDPSEPPPAHFLRNQQALLGHAGLIAGIKPSRLTTHGGSSCGASPSNPIVLEDNDAQTPSTSVGRSHIEYFKNLDRSKLPTPSVQEVVDILIKQKDIFPVLQSILKLLAFGVSGGHSGYLPTTQPWSSTRGLGQALFQAPPVKRRKLNRVPAGAADWDVPYPFLEGEGPEAYKQNWVKERGRHLVSQLVGLVHVALDKAAAKRHLVELAQWKDVEPQCQNSASSVDQPEGGKHASHYRGESGGAGPSTQELAEVTPTESPGTFIPPPSQVDTLDQDPSPPPDLPSADNTVLNDLFSALLSASGPTHPASHGLTSTHTPPFTEPLNLPQSTDNILASFDLSAPPNGTADQSLVDSWMNILQTFPLPADGLRMGTIPSSNDVSLESLFGIDTPSDFSAFASPVSGDASSFSTTPNPDSQQSLNLSSFALDQALNSLADGAPSLITDQTQLPMDFTFDLPALSRKEPGQAEVRPPAAAQAAPMDVDEPLVQPLHPKEPIPAPSTASLPSQPVNIDELIDPRLLALSVPNSLGTSQNSHTGNPSTQQASSTSSVETQAAPAFLLSPVSTLEPATPSSAEWDLSLPQVNVGEQHQSQGPVGASKEPLNTQTGSRGPAKKRTSRPTSSRLRVAPSDPASATPQPAGVFSVLRVEDLQPKPEKSTRKLKKTDVLKKAGEKRQQLKTRLEQVKIKLWETTIEHGALLQLMRMSGDEENVQFSSLSGA